MKKDSLSIDGKVLISSNRASEIAGYSKDYIGQLCRERKLVCRRVGRKWYVDERSLKSHQAASTKANQTSFGNDKVDRSDTWTNPAVPPRRRRASPYFRYRTLIGLFGILIVAAGVSYAAWYPPDMGSLLAAVGFGAHPSLISNTASTLSAVGSATDDSLPNGGLVVVPSQSSSTDAKLAQTIRNSFSDQVKIKPDTDGTTGVITPVFRTVKGHDYLYVLVPVKATTTSSTTP